MKTADQPALNAQRKRLRQVELLLEVSRRMAAYDTLDENLTALVEVTTEELDAERGTLFLNDAETGELFSRVAQGNIQREIRFLNHTGIAGHVFTTGEPVIIADAYADPRFNRSIDEQTGFVTRTILCVPIKTVKGEIIGVSQTLNKRRGKFTRSDLQLLEALTTQGTLALQSAGFLESMKKIRRQEMEFIDVVSEVTADIKLGSLLQKVMGEATRLLNAERSTPVGHEDDADRAVRAAIAMVNELRAWNLARAGEGKPPVEIGIRLNTDQVVSGSIGSRKRMDYTIIGDGVNLAARLESAFLQSYRKRNWNAAGKLFEEVLALNPRDQVTELYVGRCRHMAVNPPPAEWDGTFIMESK